MNIKNETLILPLPLETLIKKEESYWRIELPSFYKEFIMKYNGGVPEEGSFICNGHSYFIERFLCILDDSENNKLGMYDIDVVLSQIEDRLTDNEDLVGVELLPIASLYGGDFVCLNFKESKNNPTVCIWNHEESQELDPVIYDVSNKIDVFFDLVTK